MIYTKHGHYQGTSSRVSTPFRWYKTGRSAQNAGTNARCTRIEKLIVEIRESSITTITQLLYVLFLVLPAELCKDKEKIA